MARHLAVEQKILSVAQSNFINRPGAVLAEIKNQAFLRL